MTTAPLRLGAGRGETKASRLNYDTRWLPPATPRGHAANDQQPPARDDGRKKCSSCMATLKRRRHAHGNRAEKGLLRCPESPVRT